MFRILLRFLAVFIPTRSGWTLLNLYKSLFARLAAKAAAASFNKFTSKALRFGRRIAINLAIGIAISIILAFFHESRWLQQPEDNAIDWVMAMWRASGLAKQGVPYAFIDIDKVTYQNWCEPIHIPRARLLELIQAAVRAKPVLIVVDVDLSRRGQSPEEDKALGDYLSQYRGPNTPPIILPQTFSELLERQSARSPRKSFLDDAVGNAGTSNIFWASPLFEIDQSDRKLRRWRLWEETSDHRIIPSIELLAAAILKQPREEPGVVAQQLQQDLSNIARDNPKEKVMDEASEKKWLLAGMELNSDKSGIAQRIIYSIPWQLRQGEDYPNIRMDNGYKSVILAKRPAWPLSSKGSCVNGRFTPQKTEGDTGYSVDTSWLAGRVVIIGASFEDSRDFYETPLGPMPGALVIVNAIHSLYQYGLIQRPPVFLTILIEAGLIIVMSVAFTAFDSFRGLLISGGCIIFALVPISLYVFKSAVWLDFVLPLIAVQLHEMVESVQEARKKKLEEERGATRPQNH
jgi:CHASE2 domain-containing sensor protein